MIVRRLIVTAIFITATGPDVGKTLVVASLIRHLQQNGHAVDAIKPIVCAYEDQADRLCLRTGASGIKRSGDAD